MRINETYLRSLSRNEAKVVLDLEWRGQKTVTLADLRKALKASETYARFMAHRLVKKGWFERLRPGIYQLVPADRGLEGVGDSNPFVAAALEIGPHFYSYGTACTHHGLTEQVFSDVYVAWRGRPKTLNVRAKRYVLIHLPEGRFFGFEEVKVLGATAAMATPERAVLDALDRPRYAGGIGEVSRIVRKAARRIAWDRLLEYLKRWNESAVAQRLGYLLDLHGVVLPGNVKKPFRALVRPGAKVYLGSRSKWGIAGHLDPDWNIIENVPRDVLLERGSKM
jgi:predicted transcriptional regulator of viral defense system